MKLREILRFELAYQVRRVSTWLYFAVLVVVAFNSIRSNYIDDARDGAFLLNSPFVIAAVTVLGSLLWLLVAAAVAGDAAARDVRTRIDPLIYAAPVTKTEYLGGRFLAAFVLNACILLAVPAGILLALLLPGVESEILGPFRPASYLSAYVFIALPNAFAATAVQFSFSALSRRALASYLGSVLLFVTAYVAAGGTVVVLHLPELGKLLDPIGVITVVSDLSRAWTPIEKNTRLIGPEGSLLANRLLWLGIALGMLAFTHRRFRFGHPATALGGKGGTTAPPVGPGGTNTAPSRPISIPQVRRTFGFATHARQTLAIAGRSFRAITRSRVGLVLLAAIAMLAGLYTFGHMSFLGVPLVPRTELVLNLLTAPLTDRRTPWVIIPLLTIVYAGEVVWRERDAGLAEIADAAPVPEWALFLGRFLGLGLVLVAWMGLLTAAGMLVQVGMGYRDLEIGRYLQILFGLQLADYLLFALLALVVHVLVNQRHVGHLVALVVYASLAYTYGNRILEHHLLVYGSDPGWSYTDMSGFGPSLGPWMWFKLYWAAWALLLAVVARLLWVRGRERGLGVRLRLARRRFTRPTVRATAAAVALVLALGGFIFYNTNVLNAYATTSDRMERRAEYERRYERYGNVPQPRLTAVDLHVEIYPERREVEIHGAYRLVNDAAAAIDSIHVTTVADVATGAVALDRAATRVLDDEELGYRIYALEEPLQPGDALSLDFEVRLELHGFRNSGVDASVVANGTYLTNEDWMPALGYQPSRELSHAADRRQHGLPPRPAVPSLSDVEARQRRNGTGRIAFEAVVGTDADQIAVAPGTLRRTWTEGGRRYFHYAAEAPIQNRHALFSAKYAVHEARWDDPSAPPGGPGGRVAAGPGRGVAIRIFHDPRHTANLDRMVRSVRAALSYYTQHFGPYPYRQIRLIEHPSHGFGLHSEAIDIAYDEGFSFLNPPDASRGLDLVFSVVAHEVAHQWWGAQLPRAHVEGSPLLSESLAQYSAMRVVEKTYGGEQLRRLLRFMRTENPAPPTRAGLPLLRASDLYCAYRKGPFAMYALSEYIGEEPVDEALRRLLEKHASGASPLATSLDLYRELQAVTPDSFQSLLHDLFEANTFWELETERATAEQTDDGTWHVTLDVKARKVVVDSAGVETPVPMEDWVEIGVFAPAEEGNGLGEPIYVQKHRIDSGEQTVTVTVPRKPARAGIDPYHLLIDWKLDDNVDEVKVES